MCDKAKKMNLQQFGIWLQEKAGAEIRQGPQRLDCVVSIDHIEAGSFLALFVLPSVHGLAVFELAEYFPDADAAWRALAQNSETYAPISVREWVEQQYITDRQARVEKFNV